MSWLRSRHSKRCVDLDPVLLHAVQHLDELFFVNRPVLVQIIQSEQIFLYFFIAAFATDCQSYQKFFEVNLSALVLVELFVDLLSEDARQGKHL